MNSNAIARVILFLNAHQNELLELGAELVHEKDVQANRFDRRVLTERFLYAIAQGTAAREPITLANIDLMVKSARQLTDLFLADLRHAEELAERPIHVAGVAPAQS